MKHLRLHPVAAFVAVHLLALTLIALAADVVADRHADHTSPYSSQLHLFPLPTKTSLVTNESAHSK